MGMVPLFLIRSPWKVVRWLPRLPEVDFLILELGVKGYIQFFYRIELELNFMFKN